MNDTQKSDFLAKFDFAGQRRADGKIYAYPGESVLDDWPEMVTLCGHTYTLEDVYKGENGYESAAYA